MRSCSEVSRIGFALIVLAWLPSCGNGGQAPVPSEPSDRVADEPPVEMGPRLGPEHKLGEPVKVSREESPSSRLVEVFGFARNLGRAHLRSGGLLVDLGTEGRHKYTLGDWKTGWRGDFVDGTTTFSYISGAAARIFFDLGPGEAGGGEITLRARSVGSDRGRIYLNGNEIGVARLPKEGWGHASIPFEKGLVEGTNELIMRFNGKGPGHDRKGAAVAVDYVRISTPASRRGPSASTFDSPLLEKSTGEEPGLMLAPGESLTFNVVVPEGTVLQGRVRARGESSVGELIVGARTDADGPRELGRIPVGAGAAAVSLDMSGFAGQVVAVSIEAQGSDIELTGCGLHAPPAKGDEAPGKPRAKNVVLVVIDTLRSDHLHMYDEGTRVQTPYLDALGSESMIFERALAQENWTKPSVATLLTGLFSETHQTKTEKNKVPRTVVLASEHFKKLGFATAGFVANGYVSGKFGFERGWDTWTNYVREGKPNRAQFVADHSVAWIKGRPKDKPFFMYIHTIDPHVPYIPPNKYRALYDDEPYSGIVNAGNTAKLLEGIKTGAVKLSPRDKIRLEALYDGEISYHDDHLVRVHEALKEEGLLEDTLIVITSDHGEEFFDHGSVGHGHSMYEELLHVPLIVRLPGAVSGGGARSGAEVGLVDVLPTICEILGVECPAEVEGRSLVPLLEGVPFDRWPQVQFSEFLDGQRVARMGRYKIIYRGLRTTLFDLETDPVETTDLSDDRPIVLAAMRESLGAHQGRFVDSGEVTAAAEGADITKAPKKKHDIEDAEIDGETRKQLEELGYMGD